MKAAPKLCVPSKVTARAVVNTLRAQPRASSAASAGMASLLLENVVATALQNMLGSYFHGVERSKLKLEVFSGSVVLRNLRVRRRLRPGGGAAEQRIPAAGSPPTGTAIARDPLWLKP